MVRATGGLDVFAGRSEQNAANLIEAFRDLGFDVPELTPAVSLERGKIVRIGVPPRRLEVINEITGVKDRNFSCSECIAPPPAHLESLL